MLNEKGRGIVKPKAIIFGLWAINVLIVAFGWPFLVYSAIADCFSRRFEFGNDETPSKPKPTGFLPCGHSG